VRLWARSAALALAGAGGLLGGPDWLAGALWGGGLVEINLSLLLRFLNRAPDWRGRSLKGTLAGFYLAFAATALVCWLVIRQHWGHPLAFLLGLLSGFIGLSLALLTGALTRSSKKAAADGP
jgi:hypothetical protein